MSKESVFVLLTVYTCFDVLSQQCVQELNVLNVNDNLLPYQLLHVEEERLEDCCVVAAYRDVEAIL